MGLFHHVKIKHEKFEKFKMNNMMDTQYNSGKNHLLLFASIVDPDMSPWQVLAACIYG